MVDEHLIARTQVLLALLSDVEAFEHLLDEGIDSGTAFLAVKAANLAPTLPIKKAEIIIEKVALCS